MKKGRVERKIDYEYIMYLYDKAKKMKNLDKISIKYNVGQTLFIFKKR